MKGSGLILISCAGLLLTGGAIMGGSTVFSLLRLSYYFWTTDLGAELAATVLFIPGALLCIPVCWVATLVPYHRSSVPIVGTMLCLVSVSMLVLAGGLSGLGGLSQAVRDRRGVNASMHRALATQIDPAVRRSFASMQLEKGEVCRMPIYLSGCLEPALLELRCFVNALSVLSCGIILVQAVALSVTVYVLVTSALDRSLLSQFKPHSLRVACVGLHSGAAAAAAPPLSPFSSALLVGDPTHLI